MLILTPTKQVVIARAGAIEPLVALLREGDPVAQGEATLALYYIAFGNPDSQLAIAQAGAIEPLVELLRNGAARSQQGAASLLGWLAFHDDNKVAIDKAGAIMPLVALVRSSSNEVAREQATATLANLANNDYIKVRALRLRLGLGLGLPAAAPAPALLHLRPQLCGTLCTGENRPVGRY